MTTTVTRRILARVENPDDAIAEIYWLNSRTRLLGESFGQAVRAIQAEIDDGSMVVVREEPVL